MRLTDIPIKYKLPTTIGVGLFLFCGVVLLYTLTLSRTIDHYEHLLNHEMAIRQHASQVALQVLQARREEKDFLARKDAAHARGVAEKVELAIQAARQVEKLAPATQRVTEIEQQLNLIPLLEKYGQTFQTIATEMEQRGLDYDSGQQKRFRDAAHALEDAFLVHDVEDVQAALEHLLRLTMTALLSHEEAHRQQVTTASQLVQQLIKEKKENSSLVVDMLAGLTLFQREMTNDPDSVQKIAQLWHHPAYTTLLELIHKVNQQAIPGSHNLYLTMRRMEKDYLLRQDGQYLNGVRQQGLLLTGLIEASSLSQSEKAHLTSHLATYQDAMDQLAALDASIQQNMESMRQTVRQTEPLALRIVTIAEELANATALETREFAEKSARFIFVICLATIFLCGMLSFFMVRTIVGSISQLWQFSHEVAHGNLEATISLDSKDEIGQLSLVMVEMVNRMRAMRLIADRMVMIMTLAARGAIPDQLDAQLHGDFQKMGTALNEMIHRLKELRLIADRVDRISHGEIPAKLEGSYQGDFKRMADAINTIIDKLQEMGGLSPQERFSQEG